MKRFLSTSICALIVILSVFAFPRISQTHVYGQFPWPLPSLPAGLPDFSQFNISDLSDIVDDIIPGITDVIDSGNLPANPLNPTNIINQLLTGQLGSTTLTGTTLSTYISQYGQNPSPDAIIPELLKNLSSQLPANALTTITAFNPQTGLFDILGVLTGNTTMVNDLLKFAPNTSYLLGNTKAVPNYSGAGCPRGNNLPNAPEGTIGPITFNSTQKYICQNSRWNRYLYTLPKSGLSPVLPPGVATSPQPQNPTTSTIPLPNTTQLPNPPTIQGGICTCTCNVSYKGCSNVFIFLCEEGIESASASESVTSASECTTNECFKRAPPYALAAGQKIVAEKNAHLEYINVTSCSSAVFTPNP